MKDKDLKIDLNCHVLYSKQCKKEIKKMNPIITNLFFCPVAELAKKFGLTEIMPTLCNVDHVSMELVKTKLIRKTTCVESSKCDYCICSGNDEYAKEHPEYKDENGFRRNK